MLPSWIKSRNWRPRLGYFLAMETTRRRLASTSSRLARFGLLFPAPDDQQRAAQFQGRGSGFFLDMRDLGLQMAHLPPKLLGLVFLAGRLELPLNPANVALQRAQAIHHPVMWSTKCLRSKWVNSMERILREIWISTLASAKR